MLAEYSLFKPFTFKQKYKQKRIKIKNKLTDKKVRAC